MKPEVEGKQSGKWGRVQLWHWGYDPFMPSVNEKWKRVQTVHREESGLWREWEEIETQGKLGLHGYALLLQGISVCDRDGKREGFVDVFTNCVKAAPKW